LLLYSVHLEVFCGPIGRLLQFADILEHSRAAAAAGLARQIIGGDLNTMGHGVARLSPYHCTDHLRWGTLGQSEAAFWQQHLFDVKGEACGVVRNSYSLLIAIHVNTACRHFRLPSMALMYRQPDAEMVDT
jgi:hypothetical protein